jgi:hypothetical protein
VGQPPTADIDGDGDFEPLTDALLAMRWAFGFTGNALIADAVDPGCTYCTAEQVIAHLQALGDTLDIDLDREVYALTDSMLLMRWGFGVRGQPLIQGAVDLMNCDRCTLEEIEPYLDSLDGE